jgi:hypothetical protein
MFNRLDSHSQQVKRDGSPLGRTGNDTTKSTQKDIFRYSYNLGKQRAKQFHRTASLAATIGGSLAQPIEETFSKAALERRRTLPRSLSVESEIALKYGLESDASADILLESQNDVGHHTTDLNVAPLETATETGKSQTVNVQPDNNRTENSSVPEDKFEKEIISNNGECSTKTDPKTAEKDLTKLAETRVKPHSLSDSVPDLRIAANSEKEKLKCEGFSSFWTHADSEKAHESRPICKLRRAARRLGVSLSSEDLYHKQRRNGVCTEIDDAADNRKLLRVLNKRF